MAEAVAVEQTPELARSLKPRHIAMIALGGIIGAGLFVGSSAGIATIGPGILASYVMAGAMILLVMRMLGEMAVAYPGLGGFTEYARAGLAPRRRDGGPGFPRREDLRGRLRQLP